MFRCIIDKVNLTYLQFNTLRHTHLKITQLPTESTFMIFTHSNYIVGYPDKKMFRRL